jgi:probable phosphoglycerate mutase
VDPLLAEGKDVLIVGHGAMNSSIVCRVRGLPRSQFWSAGIENCKLMKLI